MSAMRIVFMVSLMLAARPASAEPYWVAWEGNDYPENEGWERQITNGGATRTLTDGVMTLDTTADLWSNDFYRLRRDIDPSAGETFRAEWNVQVEQVVGERDVEPSANIFSNDAWAIAFQFGRDHLVSVFESYEVVPFEADTAHNFAITSNDMRHYTLYIDGAVAREGVFVEVLTPGFVTWGSGMLGASSWNHWDYFRFGVVPEPSTAATLAAFSAAIVFRTRRGRNVQKTVDDYHECVLCGRNFRGHSNTAVESQHYLWGNH